MPENTEPATDPASLKSNSPCGLGRRVLVMAYDAVAVIALMMAVTAVLLFTPLSRQTALKDPLPTILMLLTWFFYLGLCWRRGGMTLGMRAWKVRLVFNDATLPGWGRCLVRFIVSLISAAALGMGFFWCLIDAKRRSWHDLATGSQLIRTQAGLHRSA
jgi:uncharacterized RDD family membrane protein YckC